MKFEQMTVAESSAGHTAKLHIFLVSTVSHDLDLGGPLDQALYVC